MLYFLYTLTFFTFRITNFKIFIMKKLFFAFAFMLSFMTFAQDQTHPDPNLILCYQVPDFKPECLLGSDGKWFIPGEYHIAICLPEYWPDSKKPADVERMIQEYICLHNRFPDYVEIKSFRLI